MSPDTASAPDKATAAAPSGVAVAQLLPQNAQLHRKLLFDRDGVGRALFYATVTLFALIAALTGGRPAASAGVCDLASFGDPAAAIRPYSIDVSETAMQIGDGVCVRVATDEGPRRLFEAIAPRTWHLLLDGTEVAQATGPDPQPGRPVRLPFILPAPSSASGLQSDVVASLWTGGMAPPLWGVRRVSLRLRADATGAAGGQDLLRRGAVELRVFDPWVAAGGLVLLVLFSTGIVWLARNTALLRDRPDPGSPSSLARAQMAFWFALTTASFCYVWLLTGVWRNVVTANTLALLGIASATGLGATAIASPKAKAKSAGFLKDILSETKEDGGPAGVTVHRLIIATWTLVLGGVFASTVFRTERFPTFDPTLLTLMGLTSGIYVGFKWLGS